jgi:hypothetical protein
METAAPSSSDSTAVDLLDDAVGRRDALKKLAVGGAIVWTAPLIAKTALAAGPTSCVAATFDWNTLGVPGDTFTSATVNGVTLTLQPSSFYGGSSAVGNNHRIIASPIGGLATQGVQFEQLPIENGGQDIEFTFSQTVYNVSFTICDIDNLNGNWSDRITIVSPTNFTAEIPTVFVGGGPTGNVIGAGTASGTTDTTGPFRNNRGSNNYNNNQNNGNITLTFPGPLTSIQLQFWCGPTDGGSNQLIKISPMAFCG